MRISDWSSDVCSSDLVDAVLDISGYEGFRDALATTRLSDAIGAVMGAQTVGALGNSGHSERPPAPVSTGTVHLAPPSPAGLLSLGFSGLKRYRGRSDIPPLINVYCAFVGLFSPNPQ